MRTRQWTNKTGQTQQMVLTRFPIATALSPHCGMVAVEVRFIRDGKLRGLK